MVDLTFENNQSEGISYDVQSSEKGRKGQLCFSVFGGETKRRETVRDQSIRKIGNLLSGQRQIVGDQRNQNQQDVRPPKSNENGGSV